jgi:hypothetical protein
LGCPDSFTVECFGTVLEFLYGCHGEPLYFGRHAAVSRCFDGARRNLRGQLRRCRLSECLNHLAGVDGDGGANLNLPKGCGCADQTKDDGLSNGDDGEAVFP